MKNKISFIFLLGIIITQFIINLGIKKQINDLEKKNENQAIFIEELWKNLN